MDNVVNNYHIFINDYLILKSTPRTLRLLQNRLQRQLTNISSKLIDQVINTPYHHDHKYDDTIKQINYNHTKNVIHFGSKEIIRTPKLDLTRNIIPEYKLNQIIDNRATRLSDYTLNRLHGDILPKLKTGIEEGQSRFKTMESLRTEFKGLTDNQLMRITRTETHSAYNQSKLETMNSTDLIPGKRWLSSGLSNSRPWHEEANDQTVSTEEPFIVNDEELMYPGDPSGSPENVINCACTMVPDIRYGRGG